MTTFIQGPKWRKFQLRIKDILKTGRQHNFLMWYHTFMGFFFFSLEIYLIGIAKHMVGHSKVVFL